MGRMASSHSTAMMCTPCTPFDLAHLLDHLGAQAHPLGASLRAAPCRAGHAPQ
jgi:hypothetical protein